MATPPLLPKRRYSLAGKPLPVWLFDLDNTLHDSSKALFQAIDMHMNKAVETLLGCSPEEANLLRLDYWQRYGATVIGLVRHHGVCANTFLQLAHDFPIAPLVHAEQQLAVQISRLPGRKVLLTNAPFNYAKEVLQTLKLSPYFEQIWSINHMCLQGQIRPKPARALMLQVKTRLNAKPQEMILVEDTLRNLKTAHMLGMRTVHIFHPETPFSCRHAGRPAYVDLRVSSIRQLAQQASQWLNGMNRHYKQGHGGI